MRREKTSVWLLQPHWAFCYATLRKVSRSFSLVIQQLPSDLRDVYQEVIKDITKRMGEGMEKFLCKEDFKYEENSVKAVQCLNEMVTNALLHVEDCLVYMSNLRDPAIFQFCTIPLVINMENLTIYYNNVEIFKGVVEMRRGICAKIIDQTRMMADVYGAFFDFCCIMESKVDRDDPNATSTLKRLEEISKTCRNSGTLINQRFDVEKKKAKVKPN
ncbi:hypothetical protein MTR67_046195 [Solanum verrucosum]|uniref:Uncharacterized protein n=1 Tax=Solanum verrucosum TaxID=315347 RepID=A0AAF0UU38_SOLVR|nr:hypothetical protein MTR67_046195 [Solanum verrucosum]